MNESELKSPPRPQRLMALTPRVVSNNAGGSMPQEDDKAFMKFEEGLVDRAVTDLPNIASQVFSMNKDQNVEIKKNQDLLTVLQEKVREDEELIAEVELEIKCVMNKVYMKEEETKDTNKRIKQLDTEIRSLIVKVCDEEQDVRRTNDEADHEIRKLKVKLEEVQRHRDTVEQFEQCRSKTYIELQKVKNEVEELRKQKAIIDKDPEEIERLLSGTLEKEAQSEIEALKTKLQQAKNEAMQNNTKITEEKQKQRELKQTIQVLHKRNAAQMTRLKRQVKEVQTRNRQKEAQLTQLHADMAKAEAQLAKQE